MRRSPWFVLDSDVPPVNSESKDPERRTKCGWCSAHIGHTHDADCVTRQRSVVARLTIEFVTTIPESWDVETLEFVHNGNCYCASNYLDDLARSNPPADGQGAIDICPCDSPPGPNGLRYVREASAEDEAYMTWASKWPTSRWPANPGETA